MGVSEITATTATIEGCDQTQQPGRGCDQTFGMHVVLLNVTAYYCV